MSLPLFIIHSSSSPVPLSLLYLSVYISLCHFLSFSRRQGTEEFDFEDEPRESAWHCVKRSASPPEPRRQQTEERSQPRTKLKL